MREMTWFKVVRVKDTIDGGPGNDTLIASFVIGSTTVRDFEPDNITCGDGFDTAFINMADNDTSSSDCEVVVATPAAPDGNQTIVQPSRYRGFLIRLDYFHFPDMLSRTICHPGQTLCFAPYAFSLSAFDTIYRCFDFSFH